MSLILCRSTSLWRLRIVTVDALRRNDMYADVAELVDALASGASAPRGVEVQVLSSVPKQNNDPLGHYFVLTQLRDLHLHEILLAKFEVEGRAVNEAHKSTLVFF